MLNTFTLSIVTLLLSVVALLLSVVVVFGPFILFHMLYNVVCCSCIFVQNAFVVRRMLIIMWY